MFDTETVSSIFYIMSNIHVIGEERPGATFREKSLWITVVSTLAIYGYYFWKALTIGERDPGAVGVLFGETVVLLILVAIAGHVVLAIRSRPEALDERDRRIALVATRNGYYVLISGASCALGVVAMGVGGFWSAHALLAAIMLAELVKSASQLVSYRRGA
jgi:hypothetical protein